MTPPPDPFSRTRMLLGDAAMVRLDRSRVAIVGLGGVGAAAAEALARAGVGSLRLIDCDRIAASDINRQLMALPATIGQAKVDALGARLLSINPALHIEPHAAFFHTDTADQLIPAELDFVIDAIDSLNPKVALIRHCAALEVPLICCLGASSRTDPFQLQQTTLDKTRHCPLARALRRRLRRDRIPDTVPVIYSCEPPQPTLTPVYDTEPVYRRGRLRRTLPSSPTLPAIVGLMAANHVMLSLAQADTASEPHCAAADAPEKADRTWYDENRSMITKETP